MSATGFAMAKIQPPRPRIGLVARPALEAALGAALRHHRLVLLLAPAGYGKTAALTRQIRQSSAVDALAWVSADEDDHLQRFLACLTAALEPHDLPWRVAPEALATLAQGEGGLRAVAVEIVAALAAAGAERGLIVIDDAHRIADAQVFELLQPLIDGLPERWAMVIASRLEPPLSLTRLRAMGELAEFRQQALRFDEAEIAALLAELPAAAGARTSAQELLERTGGWAAGLRLSLSARPGAAGLGGEPAVARRHLFAYLASEVLDEMPIVLHDFLLRCAVLPELTAARCARVSGRADAEQLLAEVERRGLFVSVLDATEPTLRLHELFREFLEDRLQRHHADEVPALLYRAAEGEPDLLRALGYLTRAGAWDDAAALLAANGPALLQGGGVASLLQMLSLFAPQAFDGRPELHWLRGLAAFPGFDFESMRDAMNAAAEGFTARGQREPAVLAGAYACLAMLNTAQLAEARERLDRLCAQPLGDGAAALLHFCCAWAAYAEVRNADVARHFAAMLDALERLPHRQAWDACAFQSFFAGLPGMNALLERFDNGAMRLAADVPSQLRASVMHSRAWRALAEGRLGDAGAWLALADDDCRWLGLPRSLVTENRMAHMLIDALRGDAAASEAAALACEDDLRHASARCNRLAHEHEVLYTHLRAAWILDDREAALRIEASLQAATNAHEWCAAGGLRRMGRAMRAIFERQLEAACALLQPLADDSEPSCFFTSAQAQLMLADLLLQRGQLQAASGVMQRWHGAACVDDRLGGALLAGPQVLARLAAAEWPRPAEPWQAASSALAEAVDRVRRARCAAPAPPQAADAVDPALASLTEREREVLARMAQGDSNKLIARAFDLSPHTVKRHVANILGKLGVVTRGQAAARWRQHVERARSTASS